jgi:hypothetical protein
LSPGLRRGRQVSSSASATEPHPLSPDSHTQPARQNGDDVEQQGRRPVSLRRRSSTEEPSYDRQHGSDQLPFPYQLRQPGLDATNWCAELAIRFGVILLSSDTNQILKFLLRFLVPRTKLLRRPVQTHSSWLARGRSPRAIAPAQARVPKCSGQPGQPGPLRCRGPEPRRSFCTAAESSRLEGEGWLTRG